MSLLSSLESYWKLDEASGNALDTHGTNDLTETSGPIASTTGKIGNARDFERTPTQQSFDHADNASLSVADIDFTWSFWFNMESQTETRVIFVKGSDVGSSHEYAAFVSGGVLNFRVQNNSANVQVGSSLSNGTWYHAIGWHDSVNNIVGVCLNDGTPVTTSYSGGVTNGTEGFLFGGDMTGGRPFDGLIDEVGFWKRMLTSQERTDLYGGGAGLAYSSFGGGGGGNRRRRVLITSGGR